MNRWLIVGAVSPNLTKLFYDKGHNVLIRLRCLTIWMTGDDPMFSYESFRMGKKMEGFKDGGQDFFLLLVMACGIHYQNYRLHLGSSQHFTNRSGSGWMKARWVDTGMNEAWD